MEPPRTRKPHWERIAASFIVLVLLVIVLFLTLPKLENLIQLNNEYFTSTYHLNNGSSISSPNPSIYNSTLEITYPRDYVALRNYTLGLINKDRADFLLPAVTASPIQSGQQHADSMLYFKYFSHWDMQGFKPYMRYSILNGTGFVEENVAYEYTSLPSYLTTDSVKKALNALESQMVYNDSSCCQNGHRNNILSQFHNRVSIGISYDLSHVYLVEDFETNYVALSGPIVSSDNIVKLAGQVANQISPVSAMVFYDKTPSNLTASDLNTDYYGSYDEGLFAGGTLPPCNSIITCSSYPGYVTVYANKWLVNSSYVDIEFSLSKFIARYGDGVYTINLFEGDQSNPEFLTSISIFES